jgi:hypothetical protein
MLLLVSFLLTAAPFIIVMRALLWAFMKAGVPALRLLLKLDVGVVGLS